MHTPYATHDVGIPDENLGTRKIGTVYFMLFTLCTLDPGVCPIHSTAPVLPDDYDRRHLDGFCVGLLIFFETMRHHHWSYSLVVRTAVFEAILRDNKITVSPGSNPGKTFLFALLALTPL